MSFLRGTSGEVAYSSIVTGTQLNTFTTEASLQGGMSVPIIPAGFFFDAGDVGRSVKVKAAMRLGSTGTPTFTFTLRLLTSTTWSAAGVSWSTAAITVGSGVTLAPVHLEFELMPSALVGGATGMTLKGSGEVRGGTAFAAGGGIYTIPNANTALTVTLDNTVTQYVFLSAACGTSNALNLIQIEWLKVYGEN